MKLGLLVALSLCCGFTLTQSQTIGQPNDWAQPQGNITLTWTNAPALPENRDAQVLRLTIHTPSFLYTKDGSLPSPLDEYDSLAFWAYRDPAPEPTILELQLLETDGKAKFWRRLDLTHTGWKLIEVPLRYMRRSDTRTPRWDRVRRVGFYFRHPATLSLAQLTFTKGPHRAHLTADELAAIAFPNTPRNQLKIVDKPDLLLLTDATQLDTTLLSERLTEINRCLRHDLPFLNGPDGQPTLLIFATENAYREFTPRFAAKLGGVADKPTSGGYTIQAIATSSWDPNKGTLRPVYSHEYVHAWLDRVAGLPSGAGDWVQEGFANHYQIRFHPQNDLPNLIRASIADPQQYLPLQQLCSGKRIPMNRYWQALTVVRFLLEKTSYQQYLPALFEAFHKNASTDLSPHIETVLHTNWDTFTRDWLQFCRDTYAKP